MDIKDPLLRIFSSAILSIQPELLQEDLLFFLGALINTFT